MQVIGGHPDLLDPVPPSSVRAPVHPCFNVEQVNTMHAARFPQAARTESQQSASMHTQPARPSILLHCRRGGLMGEADQHFGVETAPGIGSVPAGVRRVTGWWHRRRSSDHWVKGKGKGPSMTTSSQQAHAPRRAAGNVGNGSEGLTKGGRVQHDGTGRSITLRGNTHPPPPPLAG